MPSAQWSAANRHQPVCCSGHRWSNAPTPLLDEFAALARRPSDEAIVRFADRYGWLADRRVPLQADGSSAQAQGEPRALWINECRNFADIWDVWQGIEATRTSRRVSAMAPAARWFLQSDAARPGPVMPVAVAGRFHSLLWQRVQDWLRISHPTPALRPYRLYVARRSLERLQGQVLPTIHPGTGAGICLMSNSLLAAIYWELATLALSGSHPH